MKITWLKTQQGRRQNMIVYKHSQEDTFRTSKNNTSQWSEYMEFEPATSGFLVQCSSTTWPCCFPKASTIIGGCYGKST